MASIKLDQVSIDFPIYGIDTRSLKHQLLRVSTGGRFEGTQNQVVTVRALDNLSLNLEHGDRVGLIGHNGAGKSTLLRVLANIYPPTSGTVEIAGEISTLLDIMLGMELEATGYDNIVLRGLLQGLSYQQINVLRDEIAEFTELGDYLSMPVRTYSAGMKLRLAFAIATSITPEILIIDEVINAGDESFIRKAEKRIQQFIHSADIVVIASHSLNILKDLCNKVLWLEHGKVVFYGEISEGLQQYNEANQSAALISEG
ncbi:MAG: ABC transporter ATP-binding protein [Gammaproteobacteria bacterium]